MSEESHRPKLTQAEIELLWAIVENVPKEQINSCVVGSLEAVAAYLGIRKTAAEKRWSRLSIKVRKGREATDKGATAGIQEETEAKTSSEGQEIVTKDVAQDVGSAKARTPAIGATSKRNHKTPVKHKVSQDKVVKKKSTIKKGKRGKKGMTDEVTGKTNIKEKQSEEDSNDD